MRIIHTSDIHLDSPLTSRLSANKIRERRRELLSGFGRLVDEAKTQGTEAIIIAGDLFDDGCATNQTVSLMCREFENNKTCKRRVKS